MSTRPPGAPVSLVDGATSADRRAIKNSLTAISTPVAVDKGWKTKYKRWLHIVVKIETTASVVYSLYTRSEEDGEWALDTRLGTAGVVTLAVADADNPQRSIVEIAGVDEVYISLTHTTPAGNGVSVWLATSGQTELG